MAKSVEYHPFKTCEYCGAPLKRKFAWAAQGVAVPGEWKCGARCTKSLFSR